MRKMGHRWRVGKKGKRTDWKVNTQPGPWDDLWSPRTGTQLLAKLLAPPAKPGKKARIR